MTISATVRVEADVLDELQTAIREAPAKVNRQVNRRLLPKYRRRARALFQPPPRPAVKPIEWTSERQRRAFFATNGFGAGIPYRRTGRMQAATEVTLKPLGQGAAIVIDNPTKYARFVVGRDQQRFHARTGWQRADLGLQKLSDDLTDEVINLYFEVMGL